MDQKVYQKNLRRAVSHLKFALELAELQLSEGRHFILEHPASATSWSQKCMVDFLLKFPELYISTIDQCQYGLTATRSDGAVLPARKPTKFLSSSPRVAQALSKRCGGDHVHCPLKGGKRCSYAQEYPQELCSTIVRVVSKQIQDDLESCGPPFSDTV